MLFGPFGGTDYLPRFDPTIERIADHCTLGFLGTWGLNTGNPLDLARWHVDTMRAGTGIKAWCLGIDVLVYDIATWSVHPYATINLRSYLAALEEAGVLSSVIALYPVDEANTKGISEGTIRFVNAMIRIALRDFRRPDIKLVACNSGLEQPRWWQKLLGKLWPSVLDMEGKRVDFPAMDEHEIVGADDYDIGPRILKQYDRLLKRLYQSQKVVLFPGGII